MNTWVAESLLNGAVYQAVADTPREALDLILTAVPQLLDEGFRFRGPVAVVPS